MRQIKFRAWNIQKNNFTIIDFKNTGWIMMTDETNGGIDQFTVLLDKNGKEIYEGDILGGGSTSKERIIFPVEFRFGSFVGAMKHLKYELLSKIAPRAEVIGNIHENPNLLKQNI